MIQNPEVLLVEDDPHDVELTLRVLRAEVPHARIEIARDGEEALDYLLCRGRWKDRSANESPDLVLLDLKLPKVGGLQVIEEVRSHSSCATILLVVLTSSGEHRDIAEAYRVGANSYVQKPVEITQFRAAIKAIAVYWFTVSRLPSTSVGRVHPVAIAETEAKSGE